MKFIKLKKKIVYNHLLNVNDRDYTLRKTIEELQELSLVLIQRLNKNEVLVPDSNIIEEIGDVKIRLKVLEKMFSSELIKKRINYKLKKFYKYIVDKTYKNI
jgi:hypothetical protein